MFLVSGTHNESFYEGFLMISSRSAAGVCHPTQCHGSKCQVRSVLDFTGQRSDGNSEICIFEVRIFCDFGPHLNLDSERAYPASGRASVVNVGHDESKQREGSFACLECTGTSPTRHN